MSDDEKTTYPPPERIYLQAMPNLAEPLKGGAFLVVKQDGNTRQYALNTTSLLMLQRGITAVLLMNFAAAREHQDRKLTEDDITAFVKELDQYNSKEEDV